MIKVNFIKSTAWISRVSWLKMVSTLQEVKRNKFSKGTLILLFPLNAKVILLFFKT